MSGQRLAQFPALGEVVVDLKQQGRRSRQHETATSKDEVGKIYNPLTAQPE